MNVIDGVAVLFGVNGGYSWYLVQGFPVINGLTYILGIFGFVKFAHKNQIVQAMAISVLFGWAFMEFGCAHKGNGVTKNDLNKSAVFMVTHYFSAFPGELRFQCIFR